VRVGDDSIAPSAIQYRLMRTSLASSGPNEDISVDVLGPRIVIWPMDLLCHDSVLNEVVVDGGFAIHLGPII
jgi:hypothetical protein